MRFSLRTLTVVTLLGVIVTTYVVSYATLVTPTKLMDRSGIGPWQRRAVYSKGGRCSEIVFAPIQALDERFFPARWLDEED
jgi:hypothetical protein